MSAESAGPPVNCPDRDLAAVELHSTARRPPLCPVADVSLTVPRFENWQVDASMICLDATVVANRIGFRPPLRGLCELGVELLEVLCRRVAGDMFRRDARLYLIDARGREDLMQAAFARFLVRAGEGKAFDSTRGSTATWASWAVLRGYKEQLDFLLAKSPRDDPSDAFSTESSVVDGVLFHQALNKLSPRDREILLLDLVDGYSHKEIAEMLGLTEGACRVAFQRAKRRMRENLEALGFRSKGDASE